MTNDVLILLIRCYWPLLKIFDWDREVELKWLQKCISMLPLCVARPVLSIMQRVSAKAYRDTCGGLWERTTLFLPTGPTTRTHSFTPAWLFPTLTPPFLDISGAFEDTSFDSLTALVSENTLKGVKEMGFEHMTEIQHKSIRPLLEGRLVSLLAFQGKCFGGGGRLIVRRIDPFVSLQGRSGCCKDWQR